MKFKTNISKNIDGEHLIHGHAVTELIQQHSFSDAIFLLYTGKLPTAGERTLLDALLVAGVEHGVEAPSLYSARVSAASGNSVHTAIAAGILAIGEAHGGAGEAAAQLFLSNEDADIIVGQFQTEKKRLPGFGHRVYVDEDPRAVLIYEKAKTGQLSLEWFNKAFAIEAALKKVKGKKLPLNIDGAFAAGVLTLGMPSSAAKALFVIARVAGMGAHAIEELSQKGGYQRLDPTQIV